MSLTTTGEKVVKELDDNANEIIVEEEDGEYALYVKNDGFSGHTLEYKGHEYEFVTGFVDKDGEWLGQF